uniref:uncharacterized protein LOC117603867 isoform X1 n=1 Tax=Osmia lignaria TaxID=473952 RepID=UPI001478A5B2|nr:uncharacterized protein LOC117603867 isoform X1 [Osmia lignaria]
MLALLLVTIAVCGFVTKIETRGNCSDTGWEKIGSVKPESISSQTILYSAVNSKGITKPCFERCDRVNCTAFVVDFGRSVCYSVRTEDDELIPEANSTFYQRVCVKVPQSCKRDRFWQVERSPGAVLIDSGAFHLPQPITRNQCYEKCVETGRSCQSAQFRTTKPLSSDNAIGQCSLSLLERGIKPRAYRASMYRDEYLWDQCRNLSRQEYCSYAEFPNASLPYSDLALLDLNENQCRQRCDRSVDGFICRGYTMDNSSGEPVCLLHSEDTNGLGVSSLIVASNVIYREREPCLDLRVRCDQLTITIELRTNDRFFGRIYPIGHADDCGVQGGGGNRTLLVLPIPSVDRLRDGNGIQCGLNLAFSVDDRNRTRPLVWTTIVVQFNPIVQRLGDQAVKVGCSLNDQEPPIPRNVTVHSSFSFLDPNAGVPPISSTVVNASSQAPMVTMRILDENSRDAVVTHLGQKLTLRIQLDPPNDAYDITAGHLVASSASGDASYLLLNELGCPTDPTTFPALTKDPLDGRSLISTFAAFKFPDSQLVRFNVIVRFCLEKCTPVSRFPPLSDELADRLFHALQTICKGDQISYGRRKRADEPREETLEELPLQLSIIVQNPVASSPDRLSSTRPSASPDTVLITGENSVDGLFCVDPSLALSLLIFWLIIQIALIVGCLLTVAQYRRTAIRAEEERANVLARHLYGIHGGNFEITRRVRWADHRASSSSFD